MNLRRCSYCGEMERVGTTCAYWAVFYALQSGEHDDLRRAAYRGSPDPFKGHCYVASEVLAYLSPDLRPMFVRVDGEPHWFLKSIETGRMYDVTVGQFEGHVPYSEAKGKGFLTKAPSKRARTMLRRMGVPVPCWSRYSDWPLFCDQPEGHEGKHEGQMSKEHAEFVGASAKDTFSWPNRSKR